MAAVVSGPGAAAGDAESVPGAGEPLAPPLDGLVCGGDAAPVVVLLLVPQPTAQAASTTTIIANTRRAPMCRS
jgi:hypothetical protein